MAAKHCLQLPDALSHGSKRIAETHRGRICDSLRCLDCVARRLAAMQHLLKRRLAHHEVLTIGSWSRQSATRLHLNTHWLIYGRERCRRSWHHLRHLPLGLRRLILRLSLGLRTSFGFPFGLHLHVALHLESRETDVDVVLRQVVVRRRTQVVTDFLDQLALHCYTARIESEAVHSTTANNYTILPLLLKLECEAVH